MEPFKVTKRFRHQEEFAHLYSHDSWTKAILNVEGGTVLGRTPLRWLFLVIFYAIFFGSIAVLWYICYIVFKTTLITTNPKWTMQQPGISFEPCLKETYMNIEYYEHLENEIDMYVDRIAASLKKYGNLTSDRFGMCNAMSDYGYKQRNPCVFVKVNRMIGFITEPIEHAEDLPAEAPNNLRQRMENITEKSRKDRLWISCKTDPSLDVEYYPRRSVATKYVDNPKAIYHTGISLGYIEKYGYENSYFFGPEDFRRILAVRLQGVLPNVRYNVRCYAWAKNIVRDEEGKNGKGMVHFQVMIHA